MITKQPGPITVAEGSNVELMCEATGNGNLTYQWKRVSGLLPGSARERKTPTLTIHNIKVNDSGEYYCEVNDDDGGDSVSSVRVQVTVKSESLIINCIMFNQYWGNALLIYVTNIRNALCNIITFCCKSNIMHYFS